MKKLILLWKKLRTSKNLSLGTDHKFINTGWIVWYKPWRTYQRLWYSHQEFQGFVGSEDVVPYISGEPGCYEWFWNTKAGDSEWTGNDDPRLHSASAGYRASPPTSPGSWTTNTRGEKSKRRYKLARTEAIGNGIPVKKFVRYFHFVKYFILPYLTLFFSFPPYLDSFMKSHPR